MILPVFHPLSSDPAAPLSASPGAGWHTPATRWLLLSQLLLSRLLDSRWNILNLLQADTVAPRRAIQCLVSLLYLFVHESTELGLQVFPRHLDEGLINCGI
jgi:hypothetical protein